MEISGDTLKNSNPADQKQKTFSFIGMGAL